MNDDYAARIEAIRRRERALNSPPLAESGGCLKRLVEMENIYADLLVLCDELVILAAPEIRAQRKLRDIMDALEKA